MKPVQCTAHARRRGQAAPVRPSLCACAFASVCCFPAHILFLLCICKLPNASGSLQRVIIPLGTRSEVWPVQEQAEWCVGAICLRRLPGLARRSAAATKSLPAAACTVYVCLICIGQIICILSVVSEPGRSRFASAAAATAAAAASAKLLCLDPAPITVAIVIYKVHAARMPPCLPAPQSLTLHTNLGDLKLELFCEDAPRTAENFLALAASGYYNGTIFHRNIRAFMIQVGSRGRGGGAGLDGSVSTATSGLS